jgi:hypothetical protein
MYRLVEFKSAIRAKIVEDGDGRIPENGEDVALFGDGTQTEVCVPSGSWATQAAVFSGDKWYHNSGSLGIHGPDGLFHYWFDVPLGRHCDQHFMRESGANYLMMLICANLGAVAHIYTDKGFTRDTHIRCAFKGPNITPDQVDDNEQMTPVRVCNEWGFAKMYERNPFLRRVCLLKMQRVDVARYVRVAVLLTNMHTCLHESNTGLYFDVRAWTLEEYLGVAPLI